MSGLLGAALAVAAALAYPFAVFLAVRRGETKALWVPVALAVIIWMARARPLSGSIEASRLVMPALLLTLALVGRFMGLPGLALAWPVLVSLALLWVFGRSLSGTPIVERFARKQNPNLGPSHVTYCRTVTKVWCGFFAANAAVAGVLALIGNVAWWTIYTGGIGYVLMGTLFTVEFIVRRVRFGEFGKGLHDRLLQGILLRARRGAPTR